MPNPPLTGSNLVATPGEAENSGYFWVPEVGRNRDTHSACFLGMPSGSSRVSWTVLLLAAGDDCLHVAEPLLGGGLAGSGSYGSTAAVQSEVHAPVRAEPTYPEMISDVRSKLGLNMSQVADVLRVGRPTVYGWLREEQKPQERNRRRIRTIWKLARVWGSSCPEPLGADWDRAVTPDAYTVGELMSQEHLREFTLGRALTQLAEQRGAATPQLGLGARLAAKRGVGERHDADEAQDYVTGRRTSGD